jgi:gliding motility-associated-like protein
LKRAFFISVLLIISCIKISSQQVGVEGVVNHYLDVDSVFNDTVRVVGSSQLDSFAIGDYVLFIQMTGATIVTISGFDTLPGTIDNERNCGKFEFLQIENIIAPENYIVFTSYLLNDYDNDEDLQLVKICTGDEITVTSDVESYAWDGEIGGIVALMAYDKLILNADINVSNQGFMGAGPEEDYTGGCRYGTLPDNPDTFYFDISRSNRAGNKGEGIITNSFTLRKGAGNALNGGGGGNGLYSGGAGGSSYGQGGAGGHQSETCGAGYQLILSQGGFGANEIFVDTICKAILGGGGGSSTENEDSGRSATDGGDGGGIVFILADTLIGNNYSIIANGQSVAGIATAGGGGGGGAGAIVIDAPNNNGDIRLFANGGNGGDTDDNCTGSGGGGGGGAIVHSGSTLLYNQAQLFEGLAGDTDFETCSEYKGSNGLPGLIISDVVLPLNGFLFNNIYGVDTICSGQVPDMIVGSQPKGGSGSYEYNWIQSTDKQTWDSAIGTSNLLVLSPDTLDTTTYFRRVVRSTHPIYKTEFTDSGKIIEIFVYPSIKNNELYVTDTICYNVVPQQITGGTVTGGEGTYQYNWQKSTNLTDWFTVSADSAFTEGALTNTAYYKRIVSSAQVCVDTSETDTITVLPTIKNNVFITNDTTICENNDAGLLVPKMPFDGDGTYTYEWQKSENSGQTWDVMASADSVISPGSLTDTTLYRRIVFSGNDNACIDTSDIRMVIVLPTLITNTVGTDSSRYCAGDIPNQITGSQPEGGDGVYTYRWLGKTESDWFIIDGETGINYPPSEIYDTTTYITRIVISGDDLACIDTAVPVLLDVVPYILNSLNLDSQSICENNTPAEFIVNGARGGSGSYIYEWISKVEGASWSPAAGTNNDSSYTPLPLPVTTYFARKVNSDICVDTSESVKITVYNNITNNYILGGSTHYTCYNDNIILNGSMPEDGKSGDYEFSWENAFDMINWVPVVGQTPADSQNFETAVLHDSVYFRRIVFSSSTHKECSDTSSSVKVLINPIPYGDIKSSMDTICTGDSIYVKINVNGVHSPWRVTVGGNTISRTKSGITSNNDSIPLTLINFDVIKLISIEDDSLCLADTAESSGIVNATVYEVPVADAGDDSEVCGLVHTLNATHSIYNSKGLWKTANGYFDNDTLYNTNVTNLEYGSATITWTETNWQCSDSSTIQVIFYEQPGSAEAGEDQNLSFVFATDLDALPPTVGYGTWTVSSGRGNFENDTLPNTVVTNMDYDNVFTWTVQNGVCLTVSDSVIITVNPLEVTKGFSHNGDGINDEFVINIDDAESTEIIIFDRQGHIVHKSDTYHEGNYWDGTNDNGKEVPEGTYFYILKIKVVGIDEVIIKSFVELIR